MKKAIVLLVVLAFLLASCGGGNLQSTSSQSVTKSESLSTSSTEMRSEQTTKSTTESVTTESVTTEASSTVSQSQNADQKDANRVSERYVPYKVYGNGRSFYVFVDRDKLVQAIRSGTITETPAMSHEVESLMVMPYYYEDATEFDDRGIAIVMHRDGENLEAFLIDKDGNPISDKNQHYATISRVGDKYLATRMEKGSTAPVSFDLLNFEGKILRSFDDLPYHQRSMLYFKGGEVFDLNTMDFVSGVPGEQGKFSKSFDIGDGYFAVADFSDTNVEFDPLVFQEGMYKMALYKDGNLLTDFSYFDIEPLGDDLFYLFDGDEYFFYDAAKGKRVLPHTNGIVMGGYEFSKHGSLIRASWVHGSIYITDDEVVEQSYPYNQGYPIYCYVRKNIRGIVAVVPKLISGNFEGGTVISGLNENIVGDITDVIPPKTSGDIVGMYQIYNTTSEARLYADQNVLRVQNLVLRYDNTTGEVRDMYHFFHYDVHTGANMWYEDWFQDADQIDNLLLERAEQIYLAAGASSGAVEDPSAFFGLNTFARRISFDSQGMFLFLWSGLMPVRVSKDELKEMMKPEYYEKLVVPVTEKLH